MQSNKTCALVEQYLNYLTVIKGRSPNTIHEYRVDLLSLFAFVDSCNNELHADFSYVDIHFISVITLNDMYAFISYCQKQFNSSLGTRARKIVSISQLWKYLKTKVHLIENNIAEEFETPKQPKRIPKYLILDESVRLLIECKTSPRDNCMITIFLNCALRLSELVNLNADQINVMF